MQSRPVDNGLTPQENARRRGERRETEVGEARRRVQAAHSNISRDQRVAVYNPHGHMLAQQIAQRFDAQLQRNGRPFVKADLIGLKLRMLILQGEDIETHLAAMPQKTCEDLRAELRIDTYASPETLAALRRVAAPSATGVRGTGYVPRNRKGGGGGGGGGKGAGDSGYSGYLGEEDVPMAAPAPVEEERGR